MPLNSDCVIRCYRINYTVYYLHNIPMKGKTTFLGAKRRIKLWNDSSDEVW